MKRIILISALFLMLSGCSTPEKGYLRYANADLGIQFDYPEKFGPPQERKNKQGDLEIVSFEGVTETEGAFELVSIEKQYVIPDCHQTPLQNPDREKCEIVTKQGHSFIVYEGLGQLDQIKEIQLQTKKGIWRFATGNSEIYDDLDLILERIKYLK